LPMCSLKTNFSFYLAQCLILLPLGVEAATTTYVAVVFISMYTISWVIKKRSSPKVSYGTMMAS